MNCLLSNNGKEKCVHFSPDRFVHKILGGGGSSRVTSTSWKVKRVKLWKKWEFDLNNFLTLVFSIS